MMLKYKFLSFNIFRRKKLCRFSIIIFTTLFVLVVTIIGIEKMLNFKYMELKKKNINHSYIMLNENEESSKIKKIKEIEHIKNIYSIMSYNNNEISYMYFDDNLIILSKGNYIAKENEIIVPNSLNMDIGDTVTITIKNNNIKLKIVGIYEKDKQKFPLSDFEYSYILTSKDFIRENYDEIIGTMIQVDDYKNVSFVIENIRNYGNYNISITDENKMILDRYYDFYKIINNLSNILIIFSFLFSIIVELVIIYDNRINISIMKSIGYSNFQISLLMMFYTLLLLIISFLISFPIIFIIYLLFNKFIRLDISIFIINLINLTLTEFIVIFINFFIIKKINIIKVIKS